MTIITMNMLANITFFLVFLSNLKSREPRGGRDPPVGKNWFKVTHAMTQNLFTKGVSFFFKELYKICYFV
jgi:hypothetical protein